MMDAIYGFFGTILSFFNSWTGSYALALLLYALVFKILFLPFSIKTQKNQIAMAKLRPKIYKIEKKYAGRTDQVTLRKKQQEIMELQQKEGYSALSGCLPMLLQLPLIIFLYNVIQAPLTYISKWGDKVNVARDFVKGLQTFADDKAASAFASSIQKEITLISEIEKLSPESRELLFEKLGDVGAIPNFNLFGVNLAQTPSLSAISILVLVPVLAAAFQWLSMFLMRKWQGNAAQLASTDAQSQMSMRIMDLTFPLLTLWMAFSFPAMLGLYWVFQSIIATVQQFIISKAMPLPTYTKEELKEMEKAEKERAKAQKAALSAQPKVKSLHYIDEDDYEELPEVKNNQPKNQKGTGGLDIADLKDDKK